MPVSRNWLKVAPIVKVGSSRSSASIAAGRIFVERLVEIVQPRVLVGVGRIACEALPEAQYVRHPAQSGATAFRAGMRQILTG